jgi:beta-galactosidase
MVAPLIGADVEASDCLLADARGRVRMGNASYEWNRWADVLRPRDGTEALAAYADQFYAGRGAVVTRRLGRGTVTYIGVDTLDGKLERDVLRAVYTRAGTEVESYPPGVYVEWRDGFFVAVNYSSAAYAVPVRAGSTVVFGSNPLPPAGVLVWREN